MKLTVVVTLYNEEENIKPLLKKVREDLLGVDYELILVDDGSSDNTVREIKKYSNERTRLLIFNKNHGQTTAMAAGIEHARGTYIATMDGDLQNDPSDIPEMLKTLEEGSWDVVAGQRKNRKDGMVLRKIPSIIANYIIRNLTGVHLKDYGCTLKVFRPEIAQNLGLYGEMHRFIPVLAKLQGARIKEVVVKHHPRLFGKSKYGLSRTLKVLSDLILILFFQKYFSKPIHLFGGLGLASFFSGSLISFYLLILKLLGEDTWGRPLLVLGVTLILAGIQFITFGIMAEIMMRTYYESQNKTPYRIREEFAGSVKPETV